ncbi:MAG: hypothetical protein K2F99_07855 [Muribaculaceae bacterium]|nr:hypothetical protein [Muribaculaceae bacterium]
MNKDLDHYINEMVSQPAKVYNVPSEQLRADVKDRVSNETYDKICDAILNNLTVTYLLNGNLHVVFITPVPAGAYPEYPTLVYKYGASGYEYDSLIVTHFEEGPQFSE